MRSSIQTLEPRDLRYLAAAVDTGNFTRAARILGLSPSTISRRIGRLEDQLGLTLFERDHHGVHLTAGGRSIVMRVRHVLEELNEIFWVGNRNGSGAVGQIRLGVRIPPIGEPARSLLISWRTSHPEVAVIVNELSDHELARALGERRLDLVLVPSFMLWPHTISLPVYSERLFAAIPASHPLSGRDALSWKCLARETILVQGWDDSQAQREFFSSRLGGGVDFQVHSASKLSIMALVGMGYGVTLVAESYVGTVFPDLVFKQIDEPDTEFRVDLAWLPEIEDPAVGRFIAFMRDESRLRKLLC
jgi:DNA-binding transcriptional LysR family regulator